MAFSQFFSGLDEWVENFGEPLDRARRELAPESEMIMNEFIPFMSDWCAESELNGCPDWTLSSSQGTKINRKTLGWNAAAASFAYAFGRMAELGYKYVGADQLVSGPWPDNEPAVTSLDWDTGEPNAKYWSVRMLAEGLGAGEKRLYNTTVETSKIYAQAMEVREKRVVLIVSKTDSPQRVHLVGGANAVASVLHGVGEEPGFRQPEIRVVTSDNILELGPYAVALVTITPDEDASWV